ncbi:MAG TPA: protein kinase [Polyangiaceae bacterium]|nr:protein kinase [Polyangiaceae bacterium]
MLQRGQLFAGRYRIEARIAQGGMGVIYAAEHAATEERVALKVLWPHVLGSKAAVENFQLEARIAARLGSEHIVRILDAGYDEGSGLPYLVMELLRGQTLDALVGGRGPLAPAEVLWALRQVAQALDRAHNYVDRKGRPAPIVHRDLKPENLFLSMPEGAPAAVKVLDFGIAKVLSQSQKLSQELRGTPLFMASEQVDGGALTPQVDVWALGLIAFYLLTGQHYWLSALRPEGGLTPLFNEIVHKPLEAPSERARALGFEPPFPRSFDAWFLRCVNRDPSRRFFPAGEAVAALAEALGVRDSRPLGEFAPPRAPATESGPQPGLTVRLPGVARATSAWGQTPRGVDASGGYAAVASAGRLLAAAGADSPGRAPALGGADSSGRAPALGGADSSGRAPALGGVDSSGGLRALGSVDSSGGLRAPGAIATSGQMPVAGQGGTFVEGIVQAPRPSRSSVLGALGRRSWASLGLAAVGVLGMLTAAPLAYRYLGVRSPSAGAQGGAVSGGPSPEGSPGQPVPFVGEPVPIGGGAVSGDAAGRAPPEVAPASPEVAPAPPEVVPAPPEVVPAPSEVAAPTTSRGATAAGRGAPAVRGSAPERKAPKPPRAKGGDDPYGYRGD